MAITVLGLIFFSKTSELLIGAKKALDTIKFPSISTKVSPMIPFFPLLVILLISTSKLFLSHQLQLHPHLFNNLETISPSFIKSYLGVVDFF